MKACMICLVGLLVCSAAKSQRLTPSRDSLTAGIQPLKLLLSQAGDSTALSSRHMFPLSPSYYTNTIGFFCRKELQVEKAVKLPLRFRLGSLEYLDRLEGKGRYR